MSSHRLKYDLSRPPERILIIRMSHIGDIIHTIPMLTALRQAFPTAHIGWLVEDYLAPMLYGLKSLDEVVLMPRRQIRQTRSVAERFRLLGGLLKRIRSRRYQVAIDVHGLTKSAAWSFFARIPIRIGYDGKEGAEISRRLNNTLVLPEEDKRHIIDRNLCLIKPLGIENPEVRFEMPVGWKAAERMEQWLGSFAGGIPPIIVSPGAGWPTKCWAPERFGEAAGILAGKTKRPVVVLWGPGEESLRDTVLASAMSGRVVPAPKTDILEMMELIRRSSLVITNDTGPLHIAVALGIPSVSFFGPSDADRNGPYGKRHRVVQANVPCLGCWEKTCPAPDKHCCMTLVRTMDVVRASLELLS
jgi:lipopolysaccharide heptosyltransferase I